MKHIDVRYHLIRERVKGDDIPKYVSTEMQLADALTKPLVSQKFKKNVELLGVKNLDDN